MKYLTKQQVENFLSTVTKKYHKDEFYDLFLDYLKAEDIFISDKKEEDKLEQEIFQIAKERGLIGYDIIAEVTDMDEFKDIISKHTQRYGYYIFHFMFEREDENDISVSAMWEKWNQMPPLGWIGGWCKCGHFFPYTFDVGEMDVENQVYTPRFKDDKPLKIDLNDVEKVVFCTDGYFRIYVKKVGVIMVKPYKFDNGLGFKFVKNILL